MSRGESPVESQMAAVIIIPSESLEIVSKVVIEPTIRSREKMTRNIQPELLPNPWRKATIAAMIKHGIYIANWMVETIFR